MDLLDPGSNPQSDINFSFIYMTGLKWGKKREELCVPLSAPWEGIHSGVGGDWEKLWLREKSGVRGGRTTRINTRCLQSALAQSQEDPLWGSFPYLGDEFPLFLSRCHWLSSVLKMLHHLSWHYGSPKFWEAGIGLLHRKKAPL